MKLRVRIYSRRKKQVRNISGDREFGFKNIEWLVKEEVDNEHSTDKRHFNRVAGVVAK